MNATRLIVVTNGPGELMGWARPFLRAVLARRPRMDAAIVFVPCTYATGHEPAQAKAMFPQATVIDPKSYARFLLGRRVAGLEPGAGALQYLGGDLFHATTIAKRLGLRPMTYKFARRAYRKSFERFFALDALNAQQLARQGAPPERVRVVGNLVADSVLGSLEGDAPPPGVGQGICIMPGSRPAELRHMLPFFLRVARELKSWRPSLSISFVISPFNTSNDLRAAVENVPDPALGGMAGHLSADGNTIEVDKERFSVDRGADYGGLAKAQLVITIPGTKCMEAAVLGRPMLVAVPHNRLDEIALSGIPGYLHHVPLIGRPLKARMALMVERRFRYVSQPNMDAGRMLVPELRGVLLPADVVAHAIALLQDVPALQEMGRHLAALYAPHAGASGRMAEEALDVATGARLASRVQPAAL